MVRAGDLARAADELQAFHGLDRKLLVPGNGLLRTHGHLIARDAVLRASVGPVHRRSHEQLHRWVEAEVALQDGAARAVRGPESIVELVSPDVEERLCANAYGIRLPGGE